MKFWKHILITTVSFFSIGSIVFFSSCEDDSCLKLKCKNGGACADQYCHCPAGFEGTECEIKTADRFVGLYIGNYTCPGFPPTTDTAEISFTGEPNHVKLVIYSNKAVEMFGTVDGNKMTIPDYYNGNYKRVANAIRDNDKITVYLESINDVTTGDKQTCNFIGFK